MLANIYQAKQTHVCEQRVGSDSKSSLSVEVLGDDTEQTSQLRNVTFTRGKTSLCASVCVVCSICLRQKITHHHILNCHRVAHRWQTCNRTRRIISSSLFCQELLLGPPLKAFLRTTSEWPQTGRYYLWKSVKMAYRKTAKMSETNAKKKKNKYEVDYIKSSSYA